MESTILSPACCQNRSKSSFPPPQEIRYRTSKTPERYRISGPPPQQLFASLCIFTQIETECQRGSLTFPFTTAVKPSNPDLLLIQGLQQGSSDALRRVYEQYAEGIYAYCAKILADRQRAKDVVQETFLKIRQSAGQIQQCESFKSWIFRIARNECLMEIRKSRKNGTLESESVWQEETPHDQYIRRERAEIVNDLLDSLKQEYREVLILRAYEDLSYAEIAVVTGDSESSVRSRIFKARKAMAEKLEEYYK